MKAIYTVPPYAQPPDWRIAMQQLRPAVKKSSTFACGYCGAVQTVIPTHPEKRYCNATCGRYARYIRAHGRAPHSPRNLPVLAGKAT